MSGINEKTKRGLGDIYAASTPYNATQQQINKALNNLNTVWIGKVVSCSSDGVNGSKTVTAIPMTATVDAQGNKQAGVNYVALPHYRVNAGVAGVIIDPVPGDIGVFVTSKRDISNIANGTDANNVPGSFRQFSMADSVMIATIHTSTPTIYIRMTQGGEMEIEAPTKITVHAPTIEVNADTSYTLTAPTINITGSINITGDSTSSGSMTLAGDVNASGISLNSHVHSGVTAGGSNTGGPQ